MVIKTSLVCLAMIVYMGWFYYRTPHIPIKSTKIFQWLYGVAFVNAVFDLITIYTVNHQDAVPELLNRVVHIIYLMTMLAFMYLLLLYLKSYLEGNLKFSRKMWAMHILPVIGSAIGILTLPLSYVQGQNTAYAMGPKVYALYVSIVIYIVLILYYCIRYWKLLNREKRSAIAAAVPIFVGVSIIQIIMPEALVTLAALTLITIGLILSNENVEKYLDKKTGLFNQYSFETVLNEFDFAKQELMIAIICLCDTELSVGNCDWDRNVNILKEIRKLLCSNRLSGYRICENGVVFDVPSAEKAESLLNEIRAEIFKKYGTKHLEIETLVLSGDSTANKYHCLQNIITFCTEVSRQLVYIDYLTHIHNRNALERDLSVPLEEQASCYLVADLNNLKVINDTLGHSAGDELLQSFAQLLSNTVGDRGRVYRQGGDEFAILFRGDGQTLMKELEEKTWLRNKTRKLPLSYAIGMANFTEPNFIDAADKRMYENKKVIKRSGKK